MNMFLYIDIDTLLCYITLRNKFFKQKMKNEKDTTYSASLSLW